MQTPESFPRHDLRPDTTSIQCMQSTCDAHLVVSRKNIQSHLMIGKKAKKMETAKEGARTSCEKEHEKEKPRKSGGSETDKQ